MKKKMRKIYVRNFASDILDEFDEFLASKDITIPCADESEEGDRYADDPNNAAALYGSEYYGLLDQVEETVMGLVNALVEGDSIIDTEHLEMSDIQEIEDFDESVFDMKESRHYFEKDN